VLLILAGCGGSGEPKAQWQAVKGPTFRFDAPKGWQVRTDRRMTVASRDSELVQVATFPLVHAYTEGLFTRVESELASRMAAVAKQTGGKVVDHAVGTAAGSRFQLYDVRVGDHVDEYTFVLRGKHEYQLLCRRLQATDGVFCKRLVASLSLT